MTRTARNTATKPTADERKPNDRKASGASPNILEGDDVDKRNARDARLAADARATGVAMILEQMAEGLGFAAQADPLLNIRVELSPGGFVVRATVEYAVRRFTAGRYIPFDEFDLNGNPIVAAVSRASEQVISMAEDYEAKNRP